MVAGEWNGNQKLRSPGHAVQGILSFVAAPLASVVSLREEQGLDLALWVDFRAVWMP